MMQNSTIRLSFVTLIYLMTALCIMAGLEFRTTGDDVWFPQVASSFSWPTEWVSHRYLSWSGRIPIEALLPFFLSQNIWLWRLINTGAFLLLVAALYRHGSIYRSEYRAGLHFWLYWFFVLISIFLVNRYVLEQGMLWATGSINYLWPSACLLVALVPFTRIAGGERAVKPVEIACSALALCYASFHEQTAIVLVCFMMITQILYFYKAREINPACLFLSLMAIINSVLLFAAPGNAIRYVKEIERFYPDFDTLTITEKLYEGLNYTILNHWLYDSYKPFLIIILLTLYLVTWSGHTRWVRYLAAVPLFYLVICLLAARVFGDSYGALLNLNIYETQGSLSIMAGTLDYAISPLPIATGVLVLLLPPLMWFHLKDPIRRVLLVLFYGASLCSSLAMSFVPTVYASGYRIFFLSDMLMVMVGLMLLDMVLDSMKTMPKWFTLCYVVFAAMALTEILEYCF